MFYPDCVKSIRVYYKKEVSTMTDKQRQETYAQMLVQLSRSNFRSRFHLKAQDKRYIREKGWNTIADHAADFVSKRLARPNRKTTASRPHAGVIRCSSRSMLPPAAAAAVWRNGMASRRAYMLSAEQVYIVGMLMSWMRREMEN